MKSPESIKTQKEFLNDIEINQNSEPSDTTKKSNSTLSE